MATRVLCTAHPGWDHVLAVHLEVRGVSMLGLRRLEDEDPWGALSRGHDSLWGDTFWDGGWTIRVCARTCKDLGVCVFHGG